MSESTYQVQDEGDLHRYRTEIPNIIFRLGLTPFELTLYAHLKQTAGDGGQCWKSTGTLARETGMSAGTISKAKDGLLSPRLELSGKSLIAVREEPGTRGGRPRHYISLTDVWPENMAMRGRVEGCAEKPNTPTPEKHFPSSPHELGHSQVHQTGSQVHHMNFPSSPHELKKEQSIKKEPIKEQSIPPLPPNGGECVSASHVVNGSSVFIDCYRERFDGDDPLLTGQQHKKLAEVFRGYKSDAALMRRVVTHFMADDGAWAAGHDAAKFLLSPDRWRHGPASARASPKMAGRSSVEAMHQGATQRALTSLQGRQ